MAHVQEYKKKVVSQLVKNIEDYPIIGIVNMENLPAPQLQRMRETLRDKVVIFMTKKRIMKIAIDKAKDKKKGIEQLKDNLVGMPAIIFTKDNPFALFKILKENKSNAPARAGQLAPRDIVVPAGPTSFAPGPIIGELGAIGIKTQVEQGKISIREDTVVCREGKPISDKLAAMLVRLGIEPMEVGLDLVATYEDGYIFTKKILDIDEEQFMSNIAMAYAHAMSIAIEIGYTSPSTINQFITKAYLGAKSVVAECNYIVDESAKTKIPKVEADAVVGSKKVHEEPAKHKDEPSEKKEHVQTHKAEETEHREAVKIEEEKHEKPKAELHEEPAKPVEEKTEEVKEKPAGRERRHQIEDAVDKKEIEDMTKELLRKGTLRK
jgi:large subunit ribosomal protein L10